MQLRPSNRQLKTRRRINGFLIRGLSGPNVCLFQIKRNRYLSVSLILGTNGRRLILYHINCLIDRPLTINITLTSHLSISGQLSMDVKGIRVINRHRFLNRCRENHNKGGSRITKICRCVAAMVYQIVWVPVQLPRSLPLRCHFLIQWRVAPFSSISFHRPTHSKIDVQRSFGRNMPMRFKFRCTLSCLIRLQALCLRKIHRILSMFSLFICANGRVTITRGLTFRYLSGKACVDILLRTNFVRIGRPNTIVRGVSQANVLAA